VKRHGIRRSAEMREAGRMMAEFGLDGSLAEAIADRHERFATVAGKSSAEAATARMVVRSINSRIRRNLNALTR